MWVWFMCAGIAPIIIKYGPIIKKKKIKKSHLPYPIWKFHVTPIQQFFFSWPNWLLWWHDKNFVCYLALHQWLNLRELAGILNLLTWLNHYFIANLTIFLIIITFWRNKFQYNSKILWSYLLSDQLLHSGSGLIAKYNQ